MLKIYLGGSPCTHWSIAQTKNRETEPKGLGWELFKNYVIGLKKYKPDYFLYENNKSMSPAIKEQITKELGVEPIMINSALVSAQNRKRLYWTNIPGVTQPDDKGILLKDILETGVPWQEKAYTLTTRCHAAQAEHTIKKHIHTMVAEPIKCLSEKEMEYMVRETSGGRNHFDFGYIHDATKDKAKCITANMSKGVPYNVCCEPVRIGTIENNAKNNDFDSQQYRVYSPEGKAVTLCGNVVGVGAKTGLYAVPCELDELVPYVQNKIPEIVNKYGYLPERFNPYNASEIKDKTPTLTANMGRQTSSATVFNIILSDGTQNPVYEVRNGIITIKDKQYPIKLPDGYYIIRKLAVRECMRLQTVPDTYIFPVSNSQAYKQLGNGWTVDVIAHILSFIPEISLQDIEVLSMYDGMSCGHIALDKLKANIIRYYATEIDKYAIQTTKHNYPSTIHLGDAYQVRNDDFILTSKEGKSYETDALQGQITVDQWLQNSN